MDCDDFQDEDFSSTKVCSSPQSWFTSSAGMALALVVILIIMVRRQRQPKVGGLVFFDFHQRFWSSSPCCPSGSVPSAPLLAESYSEKGTEVEGNGGVRMYVTGPDETTQGVSVATTRAVVVYHDIFGWHSGRIREVCDELAQKHKLLVVMPDCFLGRGGKMQTAREGIFRILSMISNIRRSSWVNCPLSS